MDKLTNEELVKIVADKDMTQTHEYAELLSRLARAQELEAENWQLRGSLGYAVPSHIPDNRSDFKNGIADALHKQVQELEKEVERLTERVDFARHNKNLMDWTKGQRAIQALEKIEKLESDQLWKDGYYVEFYNNILCVLADWRKGNE